ncbi:MAG: MgtC/SapB family protein [Spirochaetes bacterium]|nr:MgtC/SapB family protein [Spirochaetota bacterium]
MTELFKELDIFSPFTVLIRLIFAVLAGFFIGLDRERHSQPAGLRTHMVISLGACLMMLLSIFIPIEFIQKGFSSDPARMAAQVITGIGFLGAGAIFRFGFNVKGLTTAASIWTTSGIGLCFGAGYYILGSMSAVFLIIILYVFDKFEDKIIERRNWRIITVDFDSKNLTGSDIFSVVKDFGIAVNQPSIIENIERKTTEVIISCRIEEDFQIKELFNRIKSLGNIRSVKIG